MNKKYDDKSLLIVAILGFSLLTSFLMVSQISAAGLPSTFNQHSAMRDGRLPAFVTETTKLLADDGVAGELFGRAAAIDGNTLVIGANFGNSTATNAGTAYVFEYNVLSQSWNQVTKLIASDPHTNDEFGFSVAIDNDTIVVGARYGDSTAFNSGTAYVYERDQGGPNNWGLVARLTAADPANDDRFGTDVAISGDTLIIGARNNDDNGLNSGSAYIFERNLGGPDNWGQRLKITPADGGAGDRFGLAVGIDGDTAVATSVFDGDFGYRTGAAYIFYRDQGGADNWGQVQKIYAASPEPESHFGNSAAIVSDTVVIGAWAEDSSGADAGAAYVFSRHQGGADNWGQTARLVAADADALDEFGWEVGINNEGLIIIGSRHDEANGDESGSAYLFVPTPSGSWTQLAKLTASDGSNGDWLGETVAVNDQFAIAGAVFDDDLGMDSGSAYIFDIPEFPNDLAIVKTAVVGTAVPGQPITYTLAFSNQGLGIATGTVITDLLPAEIVSPTFSNSGATITQTGSMPFSWLVAPLPPGSGGVITITGIIDPAVITPTTLVNTAVITNSLDFTATNNSSTAVTQVIIPTLSMETTETSTLEDSGMVTVTAVLSPPQPYLVVTVDFQLADGSATNGLDYTAVSGPLTFSPGTAQADIAIPILDDALVEPSETFTVTLSNPTNAQLGSPDAAIVTILDDDVQLPPDNTIYLPLILRPQPTLPLQLGPAIPYREVTVLGETFYTATVTIPAALPAGGRFYLSANPNQPTVTAVDDSITIYHPSGSILFWYKYSDHGEPIVPHVVEVPQTAVALMAGQTVTIVYQDVYGTFVGATEIWLIWEP